MEKNTLYQSGFLLNRKWFEIGTALELVMMPPGVQMDPD